jgi:hypothetical protein
MLQIYEFFRIFANKKTKNNGYETISAYNDSVFCRNDQPLYSSSTTTHGAAI